MKTGVISRAKLQSNHHHQQTNTHRVPTPTGKSWKVLDFFLENSRTWKVLENHFGPGKSWKLKFKVLESPGKISLKVMHFSSGSNGKQAAIV